MDRPPVRDLGIPVNQDPIHHIAHKDQTGAVNPIRALPGPAVLGSQVLHGCFGYALAEAVLIWHPLKQEKVLVSRPEVVILILALANRRVGQPAELPVQQADLQVAIRLFPRQGHQTAAVKRRQDFALNLGLVQHVNRCPRDQLGLPLLQLRQSQRLDRAFSHVALVAIMGRHVPAVFLLSRDLHCPSVEQLIRPAL